MLILRLLGNNARAVSKHSLDENVDPGVSGGQTKNHSFHGPSRF
jgi:hypothetical protein